MKKKALAKKQNTYRIPNPTVILRKLRDLEVLFNTTNMKDCDYDHIKQSLIDQLSGG